MPAGRVHWYYDTLTPHLRLFTIAAEAGLTKYTEEKAQEMQDYAQENAPWEDRTGAARQGLTAEASHHGLHHIIELYHTVDYGIWLEIRWDGRFAIIEPTLEHFGPDIMEGLSWSEVLIYG